MRRKSENANNGTGREWKKRVETWVTEGKSEYLTVYNGPGMTIPETVGAGLEWDRARLSNWSIMTKRESSANRCVDSS
jgi:hypothetical protein